MASEDSISSHQRRSETAIHLDLFLPAIVPMIAFVHPALLWLAPLALTPVILHLLSRIAPNRLRFPTTRFLRNSPMPLQGRRRWQDIMLMIVRTALVAVVVMLMARPVWKNTQIATAPENAGIAAILDASPSMCACLEELRGEASALPEDTYFITTSNNPTNPSEWVPENTAQPPANALRSAARYLSDFSPNMRTLHVFSDLQSSNWSGDLPNMPEGTEIVIHSNETKVLNNWSILSTRCEYTGENQLRILATCRNWGEVAETRTIELQLDGEHYRQDLSLAPNSSAPALFLVTVPADSHAEILIIPGDPFTFDDTRKFWATPEPPHPILTVFPAEDEKIAEELEFFTIPALISEPEDAPPRYTTSTLDVSGIPFAELSSQAAIFLMGASDRLDDESAEILHDYVTGGGVLISVPGASPLAGWRNLQKAGLAPRGTATLEKRPTGIGALQPTDALHALFPPKNPSDLHLFNIRIHLGISAVDKSDSVMLKTMNDTPALIHRSIGKGEVFLFTFGFDTRSSDFPLTKSFLPLMREILSHALGTRSEIISIICGDAAPEIKSIDGSVSGNTLVTSKPGLEKWENRLVEICVPPQESTIHYRRPQEISRALSECSSTQMPKMDDDIRPLSPYCASALVILLLMESLLAMPCKPKATSN